MFDNFLVATSGWNTLVAVVIAVAVLGAVLFVGGRPNDVGRGRWQQWLIGGLVMLALIFFLGRALSHLTYKSCNERSYAECRAT